VEPVTFQGCLHLKTGASLVADDLVLVNPAWVDARHLRPLRTLEVDPAEPFAANALLVGTSVIYAAEYPRTLERLEGAGVDVRPVSASELAKAEGGVTCGSLLLSL
jgi:dimethylargininase